MIFDGYTANLNKKCIQKDKKGKSSRILDNFKKSFLNYRVYHIEMDETSPFVWKGSSKIQFFTDNITNKNASDQLQKKLKMHEGKHSEKCEAIYNKICKMKSQLSKS